MRIYRALLGLAALLVVIPTLSVAQMTEPSPSHDVCTTAPRNGDGDNLLKQLCGKIRLIAGGAADARIPDDTARPAEIKLWRNANGTAIDIDFGGGRVGAAVIARLLSGSVFIPTDRIDLLVIHRVNIEGTLDLSDATIEVAAKFDKVRFGPQADGSCVTEPAMDGESAPEAIRLVGTHAKKHLALVGSQVCGDLLIRGSRLDGGIEISGTITESGLDCALALSRLFIIKSIIGSDILLKSTCIRRDAEVNRSDVHSITLDKVEFGGPVAIVDNTIGELSSWDTKFDDRMQISNNRVQGELNLSVTTFVKGSTSVIRDNGVGSRLHVTIRELGIGKIIDLSHNKVEQASEVWLPQDWKGRLNLDDTAFKSVLSLCMAEFDAQEQTLKPHQPEAAMESDLRACPRIDSNAARIEDLVVNHK